ncbi:MAG: regulatory protein RecX [Lachnospiraceae bacterium]
MSRLRVLSITEFDRKRRRILMEGDLAFALYPGEIRKFQIEEGTVLDEDTFEKLMEALCLRARERALHLLEVSDKTESELRARLKRDGYPDPAIESAVSMTLKFHYVDDEAYGSRYVQSHRCRKSRRQILNSLLQKGIDKELAQQLLENEEIDETSQIRELLEKKGLWGRTLERKEYEKTVGMLARRGYSFEVIHSVMADMQDSIWAD